MNMTKIWKLYFERCDKTWIHLNKDIKMICKVDTKSFIRHHSTEDGLQVDLWKVDIKDALAPADTGIFRLMLLIFTALVAFAVIVVKN